MNKKLLKGDFLIADEESAINSVYLYLRQEEIDITDEASETTEEEKIRSQITSQQDEFEGEIIKIYKDNLVVAAPIEMEALIKDNRNINIRIIKYNSAYECSLEVLGMKNSEDKLLLVLSIPVIEKKVDRRRFFRINLKFGVRICMLPKGEYHTIIDVPKGCFLKIKKALTQDISAGGISIVSEEKCEVGDYCLVCLYLPHKIDVLSKVLRINPYDKIGSKSVLYMKYIYIHEIDRDIVVNFVIKNEIFKRIKNREKAEDGRGVVEKVEIW